MDVNIDGTLVISARVFPQWALRPCHRLLFPKEIRKRRSSVQRTLSSPKYSAKLLCYQAISDNRSLLLYIVGAPKSHRKLRWPGYNLTIQSTQWNLHDGIYTMEYTRWHLYNGTFTMDGSYTNGIHTMESTRWTGFTMESTRWNLYNGIHTVESTQWKLHDGIYIMESAPPAAPQGDTPQKDVQPFISAPVFCFRRRFASGKLQFLKTALRSPCCWQELGFRILSAHQ